MILETPTPLEQRWLMLLTLSLVASLVAVAWVTRKPLCVESEVVSRLEWRAGASVFDLHRCRARQHVGYQDVIVDRLGPLNERLQRLQTQGEYFLGEAWQHSSVIVRVVDEQPFLGRKPFADFGRSLSNLSVIVTATELDAPDVLESKILGQVLRSSLAVGDGPSAELLENFFLDMLGYDSLQPAEQNPIPKSDWKLALYSEAVRRARRMMPVGEQMQSFRQWQQLLSDKSAAPWALPPTVQSLMHESLAAFGYRQDLRLFQLPFAVMWPDRAVALNPHKITKLHGLLAAVILPEEIWFPFSNRNFSRINSAPIQVGRLVVFQCGLPRLDELEKLGVAFEHLLFVQSCDEPDMDFVAQALRDPKSFVKEHPEVDFAQIHWPSLRLALQKSGVTETSMAGLFRSESLQSFRKIGFLFSIDQDPATKIQSWKGPLEPFPMFRLKSIQSL